MQFNVRWGTDKTCRMIKQVTFLFFSDTFMYRGIDVLDGKNCLTDKM